MGGDGDGGGFTLKWIVIQKPVGDIGTVGSYEIEDAGWFINVIDNGDGTVTVYYLTESPFLFI